MRVQSAKHIIYGFRKNPFRYTGSFALVLVMVFVATILPNLAAGSVYAQSMQSNGNAALSLVEINEILEEELHSDDDAEPIILSDFIWVIVLEELPEIFVNKVQTPPPRLVIG